MGSSSSEEAAELVATIRGEHVVMKKWFNEEPSEDAAALRGKYGTYPGLWKEVLNWVGWKESRKAYLKHTQGATSSSSTSEPKPSEKPPQEPLPRKRRSRWGNTGNNGDDMNGSTANKRRSRWGKEQPPSTVATPSASTVSGHYGPSGGAARSTMGLPGLGLPGMPTNLTLEQKIEMQTLQAQLRDINVKLDNIEIEAVRVDALPRGHRERSPSPPPIYGADGKRKNTRAFRWRHRYSSERHDVLEKLMSMNPATRQSGLFKRKRTKKIRIPIEMHPTYNFIGLIIGPRGKTQKELESKTGCKIAIRGRGSVKEGARGRRDGKVMESDDEPLHVVITGDNQRSVDAATDMIEQMLVVIDDEKNVHKQQQLRELALLNGTLKEDEYCQICGEKGHRSFECPKRFNMKKKSMIVKCAICGDTSHPTRDCTQKPSDGRQANAKEMDSDYMSFMAELDGKQVCKPAASKVPPGAPPLLSPSKITGINNLPPPPATNLLPPPQSAGGASIPPPPPPGAINRPPPPPPPQSGLPLQPPGGPTPQIPGPPSINNNRHQYGNNTQNQYQQQHYGNYNNNNNRGGPRNGGNYYGHGGQQQYQMHNNQQQQQYQPNQQQQKQQVPSGNETQAWDYTAYYGQGNGSGGGAGGFNWWET